MIRTAFAAFLVISALAFVAGFWGFARSVREQPGGTPRAEAIVALTGGSLERLETGVRLLKQDRGERLLISGVNRDVADHELFALIDVDPTLGACCVDLGRLAEDTLGNASETAQWARSHHYKRLILVTDDYHLPRARAELALAMPEAEIYPYPVRTRFTDPAIWRNDLSAASRLGAEYVKYLMIRGREALIDLSRKDAPDATAKAAT